MLRITDSEDDTEDELFWRLAKAPYYSPFFGRLPLYATYRVCIYDSSAASQPIFEAELPSDCGGKACWRRQHGHGDIIQLPRATFWFDVPDGTPDGFVAGRYRYKQSRSDLRLKGRGPLLAPPDTNGLVGDVVIQLLIRSVQPFPPDQACFKSTFPASGVRRQTEREFLANGP